MSLPSLRYLGAVTFTLVYLSFASWARSVPASQSSSTQQGIVGKHDTQSTQGSAAQRLFVDGKHVPGLKIQIPDSYAGLLPISQNANADRELFFWWFPSESHVGSDSLVIWLNGGPLCSSLNGLFQENGPFSMPYRTPKDGSGAKLNPFGWQKISNVLYIEQPLGTGFTKGAATARNEEDVARQFYGFLVNFFKTFPQLKDKKLYLTGESYAGMYIPYIVQHLLDKVSPAVNKANGINYQGFGLTSPAFAGDALQRNIPALAFARHYRKMLTQNDTVLDVLQILAKQNGVDHYLRDNLHYPPKGPLTLPKEYNATRFNNIGIVYVGALQTPGGNPCFNAFMISPKKFNCPIGVDPLGFPPKIQGNASTDNFLNITPGFKKYIHADPATPWVVCSQKKPFNTADGEDESPAPTMNGVLQRAIEGSPSQRNLIQHGELDGVLLLNGTLLGIQNTTWNGKQGFQHAPSRPLMVDGQRKGLVHTERGLTFLGVAGSGHQIPEDQPAVAFKSLQYLLGQISEQGLSY